MSETSSAQRGSAAHRQLDPVYEGYDAGHESDQGRAPEYVPEREGACRRKKSDGQPVQQKCQRLAQHFAQHGEDGNRVRP